jgi:hypothetical protein
MTIFQYLSFDMMHHGISIIRHDITSSVKISSLNIVKADVLVNHPVSNDFQFISMTVNSSLIFRAYPAPMSIRSFVIVIKIFVVYLSLTIHLTV